MGSRRFHEGLERGRSHHGDRGIVKHGSDTLPGIPRLPRQDHFKSGGPIGHFTGGREDGVAPDFHRTAPGVSARDPDQFHAGQPRVVIKSIEGREICARAGRCQGAGAAGVTDVPCPATPADILGKVDVVRGIGPEPETGATGSSGA